MHSRIITTVAILGLVGCGVFGAEDSSAPPDTTPVPPPDPGGGTDGGLPEGAPPPPVGTPADAELTDAFGVFVSAEVAPGGDGTKAHPFATIAAGIDRVKDLKLRVYVCAGVYQESLTLVNAVSVIGSLGCDGGMWTTTNTTRSIIKAPTSPAIRAKDISLTTRFEGFDVTVPDGFPMAPNSIGLIAENAPMLTVAKSKIMSGKGWDGADGVDGIQLTLGPAVRGSDGAPQAADVLPNPLKPIPYQTGAAGGIGACIGAAGHDGVNGGPGGNGETAKCQQNGMVNGNPVYGWILVGTDVRTNAVAQPSGVGAAGTDGASATAIGAFDPIAGYTPAGGTAGTDGSPGKGGTGGDPGPLAPPSCSSVENGKYFFGASGPGGGAGGCPGLAGTAGGGGGASIAALVFASPGLTFTTVELGAGFGGKGGKGTFGSTQTPGANPGTPEATVAGYGTAGSMGGRAGFSGNGAGGPSIALAHTGGEVNVSQDTHTAAASTGGAGVPARTNIANNITIPASADGTAMPILAF